MIATRQNFSMHNLMCLTGAARMARAINTTCVAGGAWLVSVMVLALSIATLLLAPIAQAQANISTELSSYKLGVGDVITAQVVGEDELKREKVRLSDAGTLSFPYLGEIRVRGMTVGELEEYITKGLKGRYLLNPQVTVTIHEYRNFFVNGLVDKPGGYPFTPGLTVRKAISIAGGFKERASKEKINVIREDDAKGNSQRINLDSPVRPGDIITVEESFF